MTTPITFSLSSLREGRWYEYLVRFALGGAATVFAGLISSRYGASIGGLFLALPAARLSSRSTKSDANRKPASRANGEDRKRRPSMPPVPRWARSACWPSPACSGSLSGEA